MKHTIRKIEYITGSTRTVFKETIETDNIELTRKELHELFKCERILLVYESESDNKLIK